MSETWLTFDGKPYTPSCWECSQHKRGHLLTAGVHEPFHCKPDLCPDLARHVDHAYAGRYTTRMGAWFKDVGVLTVHLIDGERADKHYRNVRCICDLMLIWEPKP